MSQPVHTYLSVVKPGDAIPIPDYLPTLTYATSEIEKVIESCSGRVPKLMDVGCGKKSDIARYFKDSNHKIVLHGSDIDEQALGNKDLERVLIGNAEDIDLYVNETYDIVFSQYLLEHVQNYQKALKAMSRVVARKGVLVITLPNPSSPEAIVTKLTPFWFHVFFKREIQKYEDVEDIEKNTFPTYFSFKTVKNIVEELKRCGLTEVKTAYIPETFYRFRRRYILGKMSIAYTKLLSAFRLERLQSSVVIVARAADNYNNLN